MKSWKKTLDIWICDSYVLTWGFVYLPGIFFPRKQKNYQNGEVRKKYFYIILVTHAHLMGGGVRLAGAYPKWSFRPQISDLNVHTDISTYHLFGKHCRIKDCSHWHILFLFSTFRQIWKLPLYKIFIKKNGYTCSRDNSFKNVFVSLAYWYILWWKDIALLWLERLFYLGRKFLSFRLRMVWTAISLYKFLDGFFKNPSYKIAMSRHWASSEVNFFINLTENLSIMPVGIFSCYCTI